MNGWGTILMQLKTLGARDTLESLVDLGPLTHEVSQSAVLTGN